MTNLNVKFTRDHGVKGIIEECNRNGFCFDVISVQKSSNTSKATLYTVMSNDCNDSDKWCNDNMK